MNLQQTPDNLPVPEDDGACDHLTGGTVPEIILNATNNEKINIGKLQRHTVIYIYPMTGQPNTALPEAAVRAWPRILARVSFRR